MMREGQGLVPTQHDREVTFDLKELAVGGDSSLGSGADDTHLGTVHLDVSSLV